MLKRLGALSLALACATGCGDDDGPGGDPIVLPGADLSLADLGPAADAGFTTDAGLDPDTGAPPPDRGVSPECNAFGGDPGVAPPRLNEHVAAWDPTLQRMVVFGGNTAVPENCGFPAYTFEAATWLYDPAAAAAGCPAWNRHDGPAPPGRTRAAATAGDGAIWIHGGRSRAAASGNYMVYGDLWRFTPDTGWTRITPDGPSPAARFNQTLVYDSARDRLLLYAGNSAGGINPTVLADVWAYDIAANTWTELDTDAPPSRRMWHAALYDPARDRMVIHGGGDETAFFDNAQYFDEVHALDLATNTWSRLHDGGAMAPDGRFWGTLVYDPTADRYLMFAGHDDGALGNRNDLAAFDPVTDRWQSLSVGDRFNRPANGFCDFPPDFTVIEPGTPERRNAHTAVWADDEMLVFGGKTDCGAVDDVWHYSDATGWTNPVIATEGEMCIRFRANPDNCVNMCF
ncbi:MAG: hypothetical protein H6701_08905 [Myxococcales bacterium]|nr:hypothetical protein [Myxococcales bacterium]